MMLRGIQGRWGALAPLLGAIAIGGCFCGPPPPADAGPVDEIECGPGTVLVDGQCVPDGDGQQLQCGPGTVPNQAGDACVPDLDCPPGTAPSSTGTGCDLLCAAPKVFDAAANGCACPAGLVDDGAGGCGVDPGTCGEGTAFIDGACVPLPAPTPADDDLTGTNGVTITLPGVDAPPLEIGGVVGPPDRETGFDVDLFVFQGTAGDRLRIQVVSFGAPNAAFSVFGIEDASAQNGLGDFSRIGAPGASRVASREVVLPLSGQYAVAVTDWANFLGAVFPVGFEDATYSLVVDVLPSRAATDVAADGAVHTGSHEDVDAYRVLASSAAEGTLLHARLGPNPPDVDPGFDTQQVLWWVDDGTYFEAPLNGDGSADALLEQTAAGATLFVDYFLRVGNAPDWDYAFSVEPQEIVVGPTEDGEPVVIDTEGAPLALATIELAADRVYRIRAELPTTSTLANVQVELRDGSQQVVRDCAPIDPDALECLVFVRAGEAGTYYVAVQSTAAEGPLEVPNHNLRISLEGEALADTFALSLPGAATDSATLPQPGDDPDAFTGPWVLVRAQNFGQLQLDAGTVEFELFDPDTMQALTVPDTSFQDFVLPGAELLVRALFGAGTGTFTLSATLTAPPFPFETEVNNGDDVADVLAEGTVTGGLASGGDQDWWSISVGETGLLEVTVGGGFGGGAPDVTLAIFDSDGATVLQGPVDVLMSIFGTPFGSLAAYVDAGTYFAVVTQVPERTVDTFFGPITVQGATGDYTIDWTFDATVAPPPTCSAPAALVLGTNVGDTSSGSAGDWTPPDATCFGFAPGGYAGPNDVWTISVPAGTTLVVSLQASYDAAIAIVDGTCAGACLAGADNDFSAPDVDQVAFRNDGASARDVLVVVDGFNGAAGAYSLQASLFGDVCQIGESRCTQDGDLEVCNGEGNGFVATDCPGGCTFDAFEERAACNVICGVDGDGTLIGEVARCDGAVLETCAADGTRYETTVCPGACVADASSGAFCTFGLCTLAEMGTTTCAALDLDGDQVDEAILTTCNDDASFVVETTCASGVCDGDACAAPAPDDVQPTLCPPDVAECSNSVLTVCDAAGTAITLTYCLAGCAPSGVDCAFADGSFLAGGETCDVATALPAASGTLEGTLIGTVNNTTPSTLGGCTGFAANGGDVVYSVDLAAGQTFTATVTPAGFGDPSIYLLDVCPVDPTSCVEGEDSGTGGDPETLTFTNGGADATFFFVVDAFSGGNDDYTLTWSVQ